MGKVFDNLSDEKFEQTILNCKFKKMLSDIKVKCESSRNLTEEEQNTFQRALDSISEPTGIKLFD